MHAFPRTLGRTFVLTLFPALGLGVAGCAMADDGPSPYDDDFAVSAYDPLFEGAPDNGTLPDENKADAQYPKLSTALLATQSPVRSQGSRGVCSIFSTTALMEHLYIKEGSLPNPDFSEQYMQWSAKSEVGGFTYTEGSSADVNLQAANRFGIVLEGAWPYQTQPWNASNDAACTGGENQPVRCYTNGEPPEAAKVARKWKLPRGRWLNTNSIKAHITSRGTGVVVGMTFFYQSWNHRASKLPVNSAYWREGIVLYPNAKDQEVSLVKRAGHSILIVGWDDDKEVATVDENGEVVRDADGNPVMEKGFYIFKNSWGRGSFGVENPHGDGYGYLSMRYVHEHGSAYVSEVPTVELPTESCGNGADDDLDGATDCEDSDCAAEASCQATEARTYTADLASPLGIPDNDPVGIGSTITVPDSGTIASLAVDVTIRHSYRGDLRVTLYRGEQAVVLYDGAGGYEDDLVQRFTVPAVVGAALAGEWRLKVEDTAAYDTGTLDAWSLEVLTQ
jgi:hypothetical protein